MQFGLHFGSISAPFGIPLGSIWAPFGLHFCSILSKSWSIRAQFGLHLNSLAPFWPYFGSILAHLDLFWYPVDSILVPAGTLFAQLGSLGVHFLTFPRFFQICIKNISFFLQTFQKIYIFSVPFSASKTDEHTKIKCTLLSLVPER